MDKKLNYETVFDTLVEKTQEYVESNHLKARYLELVVVSTLLLLLLFVMRLVRRLAFLL